MEYKSLLLFGKSGSGKSTIGNYFLGSNLFNIGEDILQGTTHVTVEGNNNYLITEMIGIGESEHGIIPHYEALNKNINYLKKSNNSYNMLCYVVQSGRFDYEDYKLWKVFSKLFYGYEENFIIVFTSINTNTNSLNWLKNNENKLRNSYKDFSKVKMCYVNISEINNNLKEFKNIIDNYNFNKIHIKIPLFYILKIKIIILYKYILKYTKNMFNF